MNTSSSFAGNIPESGPIAGWLRSYAVRETFESVLVAILLALLFRYFEAEAFVIPTGSMAPDLMGDHIDVECPRSGYHYMAGASPDNDGNPARVKSTRCPMSRYELVLRPSDFREHRAYSGDRILVNKFAYDFAEPERWDVIVFRYPFNGKQNYIKRLIGLPNECILIEHGDIFTWSSVNESFADRKIARKPPKKMESMLMVVDDSDYFVEPLESMNWPSLWYVHGAKDDPADWTREVSGKSQHFSLSASEQPRWLHYRHLKPTARDWQEFNNDSATRPSRFSEGVPDGGLIEDYYAYNDTVTYRSVSTPGGVDRIAEERVENGLHWVGDLGVCASVESKSSSGKILLQTTEGGIAYQAEIDIASGEARFSSSDNENVKFAGQPVAQTPIRGAGDWEICFVNADDRLYLWVDGESIEISNPEFSRSGPVVPVYRADGASDSRPVGIGGVGADLLVTRLQVMRDLYYISRNGDVEKDIRGQPIVEYDGFHNQSAYRFAADVLATPSRWASEGATNLFRSRDRDEQWAFRLGEDQFFPLGDNSPQSSDARIWNGRRYVERRFLLGKALFIYWPHALSKPVPFWPNFGRMSLIR
jgi:signal peptidase I